MSETKKQEKFNGYSFSKPEMRKKMKYLAIFGGDMDLNNAYSFETKHDLNDWIKEQKEYGSREIEAIFKIQDLTNKVYGRN